MNSTRKRWVGLAALLIASFVVLPWVGSEVHRQTPLCPTGVVTEGGRGILTRKKIEIGHPVWQSVGSQQLGSIWGHGGYVAADWLHREAEAIDRGTKREAGAENQKQPPRLRERGPGPLLAVVPVHRPGAVAAPGRPCAVAGDQEWRRRCR